MRDKEERRLYELKHAVLERVQTADEWRKQMKLWEEERRWRPRSIQTTEGAMRMRSR